MQRLIVLTCLWFIAGCTTSSKQSADDQKILGSWLSKEVRCSSRATYKGDIKTVELNVAQPKLNFKYVDSKKKTESLHAEFWKLQDNLLTLTDGKTTQTMEALMPSNNELILRMPIVGVPGECPESDLLVITFERQK